MATEATPHNSVRRSSRLASKASRRATNGVQSTQPLAPRSAKPKNRRRENKEGPYLSQEFVVLHQEMQQGKGKGKAIEEAFPVPPPLDAKETAATSAPTDTRAAASQDLSETIKEKWRQAFASLHSEELPHETLRNELIKEIEDHFVMLRKRVEVSFRENGRVKNKHALLIRELDKVKAGFRQKVSEIDDIMKQVEALPPKFRIKVDPYGEPFRQCRQKQTPSRILPESVTCELATLRDEAVKYGSSATGKTDQSENSEEALTDRDPSRKHQRDENEESSGEKVALLDAEPCSGPTEGGTGNFGGAVCTPTERPTKRMRRGEAQEVTR